MQRLRQIGLAAATVLTLASALTTATTSAAIADPPDLSSDSAINAYLDSIGVTNAFWQTGLKNYAGPSCPGSDWNCAPADTPIVQIADAGGTNLFRCTGVDCVAVQVALGAGRNDAGCEPGDKHADDALQICDITQANTTGHNVAGINQSIEQKGSDVTARQVARIT